MRIKQKRISKVEYKIIKLIQETKDTRTFRLKPAKGKVFDFKPGHFVVLAAELVVSGTLQTIKRAYSISSVPNKEYIEITIKEKSDGLMSKHVMSLKKGNTMDISGPYGNFVFDDGNDAAKDNNDNDSLNDVVFIAGGYAQMPFYSMINYIIKKKLKTSVTFIISARYPEDVVYKEKFMELAKKHKNFRFYITYTRIEKNPEFEFIGRLDKEKLTKMIKNIEKPNYFVCGSADFLDGIKELLKNCGVDAKKIKTQGY